METDERYVLQLRRPVAGVLRRFRFQSLHSSYRQVNEVPTVAAAMSLRATSKRLRRITLGALVVDGVLP